MAENSIACPQCKFRFECPPLVESVSFPKDIQYIFDIIEQRLNLIVCPLCKKSFYGFNNLLLIDPQDNVLALAFNQEHEDVLRAEARKMNVAVDTAPDYPSLRSKLIPWLKPYINTVPEALASLQKEDFPEILPVQLRALLSAAKGFLFIDLRSTDGKNEALDIRTVFEDAVKNTILSVYRSCLEKKSVWDLSNLLKKLIPAECITKEVLDYFINLSYQLPEIKNATDFKKMWSVQYICAVLHSMAAITNPMQKHFTSVINSAWHARLDNVAAFRNEDEYMLLNKELGELFLRFEDMFDANLEDLNQAIKSRKPELREKVRMIMEHFGWGQSFDKTVRERTVMATPDLNAEESKTLADKIIEDAKQAFSFSKDGLNASENATVIEVGLEQLMPGKKENLAVEITNRVLELAKAEKDFISCIAICTAAIKLMNKYYAFEKSRYFVQLITEDYHAYLKKLPRLLYFNYLNESGNTLRYMGHFSMALKMYLGAQTVIEFLEKNDQAEASLLMKRNIAIIYRDTGEFAKCLPMYNELLAEQKNNFGIVQNAAFFYSRINLFDKAIDCLLPFLNNQGLSINENFGCRLSIAQFYAMGGESGKAFGTLTSLYNQLKNVSLLEQFMFLNVCLLADIPYAQQQPAIKLQELANQLFSIADKENLQDHLVITAYYFFLKYLLDKKEIARAKEFLKLHTWMVDPNSNSWQLHYIMCCYYFETGSRKKTVSTLRKMIDCININIPQNENIDFAIQWMRDKDQVQQKLISMAISLFLKNAIPATLILSIIDFNYGKDVSTRMLLANEFPLIEDVLNSIASEFPHTEIFVFFEVDEEIRFINISTTADRIIIGKESLGKTADFEKTKIKIRTAYKNASPAPSLLKYTDMQLAGFMELMQKTGAIFSQWITDETQQVYFITGRTFSNLPLHLMKTKNGNFLIEQLPVCFASSLSAMALLHTNRDQNKHALVSYVTKENEKTDYTDNAKSSASNIQNYFTKQNYSTTLLAQQDATIASVTEALAQVNEAVFICHGTTGSEENGAGICLSYEDSLPMAILPVKEIPRLKNFLLTWQDLDDLKKVPEIFVSAACSTGTIQVGKGGVQFGLEQTLFAKGCTTLISPLWDVDQLSAHYWLEKFYENRNKYPTLEISKHYRLACLDTKERYPHHYFWAPFIFKGKYK